MDSAAEITRVGSTVVSGMGSAKFSIAVSMVWASVVQSLQQLWWSVASRATNRDRQVVEVVVTTQGTGGFALVGLASARSILACASAYASLTSALAKYGCCGVRADSEWQREHHWVTIG